MKVIGYVRVSTEEQAAEGISLEVQESKIKAYCALHDLELVEIISDPGQSAKTLKRPGIQRALKALKRGHAEGLVVMKLDRLSRCVADWNQMIKTYFDERAGKQLLSVSDHVDTRSAAGRLVLNIMMTVYQWEREAIGERTKDALAHKARNGERVGEIPYGHDLAEDGKLIENSDEQEAIEIVRELRRRGLSLRRIAAELTRRGISTKKGRTEWNAMSVRSILKRAA